MSYAYELVTKINKNLCIGEGVVQERLSNASTDILLLFSEKETIRTVDFFDCVKFEYFQRKIENYKEVNKNSTINDYFHSLCNSRAVNLALMFYELEETLS